MIVDEIIREHVQSTMDDIPHRSGDLARVVARGRRRRQARLVAGGVGAALAVVLMLAPLLTAFRGEPDVAGVSVSQEEILADGWVTEEEYLAAGEATLSCVADGGFEAYFLPDEMAFGTRYPDGQDPGVRHPASIALKECIAVHIDSVMSAWSSQHANGEARETLQQAQQEIDDALKGLDEAVTEEETERAREEVRNAVEAAGDAAAAEAELLVEAVLGNPVVPGTARLISGNTPPGFAPIFLFEATVTSVGGEDTGSVTCIVDTTSDRTVGGSICGEDVDSNEFRISVSASCGDVDEVIFYATGIPTETGEVVISLSNGQTERVFIGLDGIAVWGWFGDAEIIGLEIPGRTSQEIAEAIPMPFAPCA